MNSEDKGHLDWSDHTAPDCHLESQYKLSMNSQQISHSNHDTAAVGHNKFQLEFNTCTDSICEHM